MKTNLDYDVALSFAGEDRVYVERVAHVLRDHGVKVFYDQFEEANLWGKELYAHLTDVYQNRARYTVMFISEHYSRKLWAKQERQAAQARAFEESREYILPARFDTTEIPGVLPTVGYISLWDRTPEDLASIVMKKLVSSGGTVPTEIVRKDFGAATWSRAMDATQFVLQVRDDGGSPIRGADVTLQADNGTTLGGKTDDRGYCSVDVKTRRIFCLLVAHPNFPAWIVDKIDTSEDVMVTLPRADNVGSVIIHGTGYIPGVRGRLNPILDTHGRRYLYADNIAIDGGKPQPATFSINQSIELEDADGTVVYTTVKYIAARVALMQFAWRPQPVSSTYHSEAHQMPQHRECRSVLDELIAQPKNATASFTTFVQVRELIGERTNAFFGRHGAIGQLNDILEKNDRGAVVVTGSAGIGKSALLANWGKKKEAEGYRVAWHLFNRTMHRTIQTVDALSSLLIQISSLRNEQPPSQLSDVRAMEDGLNAALHMKQKIEVTRIGDVLRETVIEDPEIEPELIVILDGLDEAEEIIPPLGVGMLRRGIYLVVSGRTDHDSTPRYLSRWVNSTGATKGNLSRIGLSPLSIDGVIDWVAALMPAIDDGSKVLLAQKLEKLTNNIPLYLKYIVEEIAEDLDANRSLDQTLARIQKLPAPFIQYAGHQLSFLNDVWGPDTLKLFALLTSIKGSVSTQELSLISGVSYELRNLDHRIARWFEVRSSNSMTRISFLHPGLAFVFAEALALNGDTKQALLEAKLSVLQHCRQWRKHKSIYSLAFSTDHLNEINKKEEAVSLLCDYEFLLERYCAPREEGLLQKTKDDLTESLRIAGAGRTELENWADLWALLSDLHGLLERRFGRSDRREVFGQIVAHCGYQKLASLGSDPWKVTRVTAGSAPVSSQGSTIVRLQCGKLVHWDYLSGNLDICDLLHGDVCRISLTEGHVRGVIEISSGNIVVWTSAGTIDAYTSDGALVSSVEGWVDSIVGVVELKDKRILSWSADGMLRIWTEGFELSQELRASERRVDGALELTTGEIASWSIDGQFVFWTAMGEAIRRLKLHSMWLLGVVQLTTGEILTWSADGTLKLLDHAGNVTSFVGHEGWVTGAKEIGVDQILSWSSEGVLRIWHRSGKLIRETSRLHSWVEGAEKLDESSWVSWGWNDTAYLCAVTKEPICLPGHLGSILGMRILHRGHVLTWGEDGSLRLWDNEGSPIQLWYSNSRRIRDVSVALDGKTLILSSGDALVELDPFASTMREQS